MELTEPSKTPEVRPNRRPSKTALPNRLCSLNYAQKLSLTLPLLLIKYFDCFSRSLIQEKELFGKKDDAISSPVHSNKFIACARVIYVAHAIALVVRVLAALNYSLHIQTGYTYQTIYSPIHLSIHLELFLTFFRDDPR